MENQDHSRGHERLETLSEPQKVRLYLSQLRGYEEAAAIARIPLGTYLRERLLEYDNVQRQLEEIRRSVAGIHRGVEGMKSGLSQASDAAPGPGMDSTALAMLMEILLLMRTLGNNPMQRVSMVQAELQRNGIAPWNPENGAR